MKFMIAFRKKMPMTVFTYHGDIDTLMSPLDSIRYYKTFLRSGFMSMDPKTGAVKAYVGGLDYTHFMYDMVSLGRRQVGSYHQAVPLQSGNGKRLLALRYGA